MKQEKLKHKIRSQQIVKMLTLGIFKHKVVPDKKKKQSRESCRKSKENLTKEFNSNDKDI